MQESLPIAAAEDGMRFDHAHLVGPVAELDDTLFANRLGQRRFDARQRRGQRRDHPWLPMRQWRMRMWGLPFETGSGICPCLPQPPPWFMSRSLPMASMFSSVEKRLPVS